MYILHLDRLFPSIQRGIRRLDMSETKEMRI